jgi:hypothetical protein
LKISGNKQYQIRLLVTFKKWLNQDGLPAVFVSKSLPWVAKNYIKMSMLQNTLPLAKSTHRPEKKQLQKVKQRDSFLEAGALYLLNSISSLVSSLRLE